MDWGPGDSVVEQAAKKSRTKNRQDVLNNNGCFMLVNLSFNSIEINPRETA
jgi:hypothetical protein